MTNQKGATGPPVAMDRPMGQPHDLPKEANTRIVDLPQGSPRHDRPRPRQQGPTAIPPTQKPPVALPPPEASETATRDAGPTAMAPETPDETGGPAPAASSKAPTRKVLAAGAGGGGIGVPLSVILAYYLPELPTEVAVAYSGLLVAILSFLLAYLTPPEQ